MLHRHGANETAHKLGYFQMISSMDWVGGERK
jgi:hypothetical protein